MKKILVILSLLIGLLSYSQQNPKLVVGIVVDQMRYDYIYRFWEDFGEDGFKKLINEGHFFRNCQFGYVPTISTILGISYPNGCTGNPLPEVTQ